MSQEKNLQRMEDIRKALEGKDILTIRMRNIMNAGLKFHGLIWAKDDTPEAEAFWKFAKEHPNRFRARQNSFQLFFSKFAKPVEIPQQDSTGDKMTPEKLEEMELTDEELERLAVVNEEQKAEGEPSNGNESGSES